MDSDFERLFKTSVRFRIIEKRTKTLEDFISAEQLAPLLSIECRPLVNSEPKRCFINVEEQIRRSGGTMMTGWIFNEFEDRFIEGEAHAIWISPQNKRMDITPHQFQPKRVLFSPAPHVATKRGYTAAPKLILSDDPRIIALERFDSFLDHLFEERFEGFGKYSSISLQEVEAGAHESGLPVDVGQWIFEGRSNHQNNLARKYAAQDGFAPPPA